MKTKNRRPKALHKRIALHASSLLLLLGGGFLPMPIQYMGQSIQVSAKVPAPLPTDPAIITSPHDGDHFGADQITVSGTCPDDTYVKVLLNGQPVATANCVSNQFTTVVTLQPGANTLQAQDYNITDDAGPSSGNITVYYDVSAGPTPAPAQTPPATGGNRAPSSGTSQGGQGESLSIAIPSYRIAAKHVGEAWQWDAVISGGTAPYAVTIDWGDGTVEQLIRQDLVPFAIGHIYKKQGTYQPLITVRDAHGLAASIQIALEVREWPSPIAQFLGGLGPWVTWPAYVLIVVLIGLFWALELRALKRHLQHRRARHHRQRPAHA